MSNGFPTFYEWLTSDDERERDYRYSAVNNAGHSGMTVDASNIIWDHADSLARDFDSNTDPEDITEHAAEDYADSYNYETYDGPTRSALIHWAWNSDLDITKYGPLDGENVWDQIEAATCDEVSRCARAALIDYVNLYIDARDEDEDEDEDED